MNDVEKYVAYYEAQCCGIGGGQKTFKGQKGMGVGSFLSSVFRRVWPYLKSGAKAVGNELLDTGVNLLKDRINNKDLKTSLETHISNAGTKLGNKASTSVQSMLGMGYKRRAAANSTQSRTSKRKKRTTTRKPSRAKSKPKQKRKLSRKKKDIFDF
jgi:hypothetical protein